MDPRIACPQCQNNLSITGISEMINCSFSQENFIRITCPQCRSPLSITWISTAIHCLIGQALVRITGDGYLGKEQMISSSITKNPVPVAANSSGAEHGGCSQKVLGQPYDKIRNTTPGTSSGSGFTYASSNGQPSSILSSREPFPAIQGAASPNLRPYWTLRTSTNGKAADMDRRIICSNCQNWLPITWISTIIHCPFCRASIRIMGNDYLSKELRISPSITKNQVPVAVAAHSNGAEQGGYGQKVSRQFYDKFRNTTPGTSNENPSSMFLSPGPFSATSPNPRPHRTFTSAPSIIVPPKKRAVLCGVTYSKRRKYKLKGTVADVKNMKDLLMGRFQFPEEGIRILTEEGKDNSLFPTKKNIQNSLHWLVHDCQSGDSLVFFFSGHGLRQPEFNGDETDGFDETICPVDFMEQGMILGNDINDIIVRPLRTGVTIHAIVDACHSGTILDLPFVYNHINKRWDDNSLPNPKVPYKGTNGGLAISFSSCADNKMAAETSAFEKTMNGAMTYSFTKAINDNPDITYGQLLTTIHNEIIKANEVYCLNSRRLGRVFHKKISQGPMLSSSMEFNVHKTKFSFYPVIDISLP